MTGKLLVDFMVLVALSQSIFDIRLTSTDVNHQLCEVSSIWVVNCGHKDAKDLKTVSSQYP